MKKVNLLFLIGLIFLFQNCSSFKKELISKGNKDDAIKNATLDFSMTSKFYKESNVFSVTAVGMENNENLIVVRIGRNNENFILNPGVEITSIGLPSRYIENNGKLFIWWDNTYPLTGEMISVLKKYNILQEIKDNWVNPSDFKINDSQKATHYYFCKDDLSTYKKVITKIGIGYYTPPNLNCGKGR